MKLRNKKTGAVYKIEDIDLGNNADGIWLGMTKYNSLTELNEEWEDYKESKGMQWVDVLGANDGRVVIQYSNEEETEKAVEKLKAWKRLKDRGFRFIDWYQPDGDSAIAVQTNINLHDVDFRVSNKDLDLLFEGEE